MKITEKEAAATAAVTTAIETGLLDIGIESFKITRSFSTLYTQFIRIVVDEKYNSYGQLFGWLVWCAIYKCIGILCMYVYAAAAWNFL